MSLDALRSALAMERPAGGLGNSTIKPSMKHKAVLNCLGDHANAAGESFVCVASISAETWMDRKTVLQAISDLRDAGLIVDTGRRRGRTGQVIVWHLPWVDHRHKEARKRDALHGQDYHNEREAPQSQQRRGLRAVDSESKESQKRNCPENGTVSERVPKTDSKSPVFSGKESRKRDTEPPTGYNPLSGINPPAESQGAREGAHTREPAIADRKTQSKSPRKTKPSQGHRLPDDWTPGEHLLEWAADNVPAVDVQTETETFCDHWRAQPGAKGRKADWDATWRNWMRRALGFGGGRLPGGGDARSDRGAAGRVLD